MGRSTLLMTYNIIPLTQEDYMRFMVNVFMPMLQNIGLTNAGVWHTAYGNYPMRLLVFVADEDALKRALASETWGDMESKLKTFVEDYTLRVAPFRPGFQF
ncbi:MAG: hypothetical protein HY868_14585 [Chloroflexi bacterium]|nr:hypothetical protein [Chloroflexota bacterium]